MTPESQCSVTGAVQKSAVVLCALKDSLILMLCSDSRSTLETWIEREVKDTSEPCDFLCKHTKKLGMSVQSYNYASLHMVEVFCLQCTVETDRPPLSCKKNNQARFANPHCLTCL